MHKSQVLGYLLIAFLVGIATASAISTPINSVLIIFLLGIILIAISGYRRTYSSQGLLLGFLILGAGLGMFRYDQFAFNQSILREFANKEAGQKGVPVLLRGYISKEPQKNQLLLHATELEVRDRIFNISEDVLIITQAPSLIMGQTIQVYGPVRIPENFSDFDYKKYLEHQGVYTTMLNPKIQAQEIQLGLITHIKLVVYKKIFTLKHIFESSLMHAVSEPNGAYLAGVLLGNKTELPESLTTAFNKTGTTHILAVSGYNITIIATALLGVLVFFTKRRNAFWISCIAIIFFTILTGATASVVRAAVMGLLLLCANSYGRLYDPKNSLLLAAATMVWFNPSLLIFDVGFQLSFLAVVGLFYVYPILKEKSYHIPDYSGIKEVLLMSVAAQIFVAPLIAYYFHSFSLVSLPANLLVLPVVPIVMLLGFLSGIVGMVFPALGTLVGSLAWVLSAYQLAVIKFFAGLSFAAIIINISQPTLIAIYGFVFYSMWRLKTNGRKEQSQRA